MNEESIIFDFDGVIVDSNYIREQIYFDIFNHILNSKEMIKESITEDSTRDRYGIIKAALQKLKDKNSMQFQDLEQETKKYVQEYNRITEKKVSEVSEIPGARKSLEILSQEYPLFIITGTIQSSIDIVLKNRNIQKYFKKVYGGFRNKIEGMNKLIREQKIILKNSILVGDGKADYECAKYFDIPFVGIINETNNFETEKNIKWKLDNLNDLPEVIKKIRSY